MPCVPGLSIGIRDFAHELLFGYLGDSKCDELTRAHFMDVAMPHRLFITWQVCKQFAAHDVLDSHYFGVLRVSIKNDALCNVLIKEAAVVMGLHLRCHVSVIEVKPVHVRIQSLQRPLACNMAAPASSASVFAVLSEPGASTGDGLSWRSQPHSAANDMSPTAATFTPNTRIQKCLFS